MKKAKEQRLKQQTKGKIHSDSQEKWPATQINDLPIEMIVMIFENLTLHELVVNCGNTCIQWREIIAQFILRSRILRLANVNGNFKRDIEKDGWSQEEANQSELILTLYNKYEFHSSK